LGIGWLYFAASGRLFLNSIFAAGEMWKGFADVVQDGYKDSKE